MGGWRVGPTGTGLLVSALKSKKPSVDEVGWRMVVLGDRGGGAGVGEGGPLSFGTSRTPMAEAIMIWKTQCQDNGKPLMREAVSKGGFPVGEEGPGAATTEVVDVPVAERG